MDHVEYRSVIKFYYLIGKSADETMKDMKTVYKEECPSKATLYYWIKEFKKGRVSVNDDNTASGRPQEISDEKKIKCEQTIRDDRRVKIRDLADILKISYGSTYSMISQMGYRKLCSRFVPKFLSPEMKDARFQSAQSNLALLDEFGTPFLNCIVTQDETTLSKYLPETKRQSSEWRRTDEKPPIKMRSGTIHRREFMFSIFWCRKGIITYDFCEKGTTINAAYFSQLVAECKRKKRKSPNMPLWLLIDNAPVHSACISQETIAKCGFTSLRHPPYSPDIAPSDFYLFNYMKKHLRGHHFSTADDLKEAVVNYLSSLEESFFVAAFDDLVKRWKKLVANEGGYIEK